MKRRVEMFTDAGADVALVGFVRDRRFVPEFSSATVLAQTHNARFLHRMLTVLAQSMKLLVRRDTVFEADMIIARNLEMLVLARVVQMRAGRQIPLIYECLDVHRLMLGTGLAPRLLRALERRLSRSCAGLITSSSAYVNSYFQTIAKITLPVILIENKVFGVPTTTRCQPPAEAPPWIIAWNGAIRCAKSLRILDELTSSANGSIRVVIRGRVSHDQIPDFDEIVGRSAWIAYKGPYQYPEGLDEIYDGVHFSWTIDFFLEGQNSALALANRIYESGRAGVVPIAQRTVETGRYYDALGIGIVLNDVSPERIHAALKDLTAADYIVLRDRCKALPPQTWTITRDESRRVLAQLLTATGLTDKLLG
ncbi:MAG: glycosyl transferase family 1 [Candidatus Kapabacteria bacterium]|nr:glycosyl transferase family 1 [Candidatus Kapabacteria bacterium]